MTDGNKPPLAILQRLDEKIDELSVNMEKMGLAEYIEMLDSPRRLLYINFLMGLARGFGMAIGFTVLAAVVIWILQWLVVLNLPLIGDFIAEIVKLVQMELQVGGPNFVGK
ncbi:MAG: hypothetical protein GX825_02480 [Syntrophomonadaceae bacterium]|nr:hypothetical protein [Syntrophomonadaceae bacterium]